MRISDWSSDVCSSDLKYFGVHGDALALRSKRLEMLASNIANAATPGFKARDIDFAAQLKQAQTGAALATTEGGHIAHDRESVVEGRGVSVRVDLGGRRIIKKKRKNKNNTKKQ